MQTISIRQPYAWLICAGHKSIENRSWGIATPKTLAVHASQRKMTREDWTLLRELCKQILHIPVPAAEDLRLGAVIGWMDVERVETDETKLTPEQYNWSDEDSKWWIISRAGFIDFPIPLKGRLGLFDTEMVISKK
ncbi:MAG TPA: ASCH domain-containing protein [Thermoflexales bacterium]|nr:ASCH domain-containing protein [Thermoflexales bacterium]